MKFLYLLVTWGAYSFREIKGLIYLLIVRKKLKHCGENVLFADMPFITGISQISIGEHTYIGQNAFIRGEGGVSIGKHCNIAANVSIYSYNHNYEGQSIPFDETNIYKPVIIEDNVWIGRNVSIIPGVVIEEGAIVGMGAVVTKNVPALAVVGGNPAKVLKYRDADRYRQNKDANQYFKPMHIFKSLASFLDTRK